MLIAIWKVRVDYRTRSFAASGLKTRSEVQVAAEEHFKRSVVVINRERFIR